MNASVPETATARLAELTTRWLERFEAALVRGDAVLFRQSFVDVPYWRDLLAFRWDIQFFGGLDEIEPRLLAGARERSAKGFRLAQGHAEPRIVTVLDREVIEAFFEFETDTGNCIGIVRFPVETDRDAPRAWLLMTTLRQLREHPELPASTPEHRLGFPRRHPVDTWREYREWQNAFDDREPDVLIVGGGHSGVMLAARLGRLGVDTLIVDRIESPGDNWRKRYNTLALHTPSANGAFPYMPWPETVPALLSKDRLADWIESYVQFMGINVWTKTEFLGGTFDASTERWTVQVDGARCGVRRLNPKHIVLATGFGYTGEPNRPNLPGLDDFQGQVIHSTEFTSAQQHRGKNSLVVGVGTSGHDIAYDLHMNDGQVTMLQRSATHVVQLETTWQVLAGVQPQFDPGPTSREDSDLSASASFVNPLYKEYCQRTTAQAMEIDKDLLEGLEKAGFRVNAGAEDGGVLWGSHAAGAGFYMNIGASDLIVAGSIGVVPAQEVDRFTKDGLRLADGRFLPLDLIVLATGFHAHDAQLENFFGREVASAVGEVGGWDERGEIRNGWKRTAQPNLWCMVNGGLAGSRINSRYLALQLKAATEGILRHDDPRY